MRGPLAPGLVGIVLSYSSNRCRLVTGNSSFVKCRQTLSEGLCGNISTCSHRNVTLSKRSGFIRPLYELCFVHHSRDHLSSYKHAFTCAWLQVEDGSADFHCCISQTFSKVYGHNSTNQEMCLILRRENEGLLFDNSMLN